MATEQEVLARKKEISDRISTQVRTLALSFIAVAWLFLVPTKDGPPVLPHAPDKLFLIGAGLTALLAMVIDFLQYVAAYQAVQQALKVTRDTKKPSDFEYDYDAIAYRAQTWCFWGKQLFVAASFLFLAVAFAKILVR